MACFGTRYIEARSSEAGHELVLVLWIEVPFLEVVQCLGLELRIEREQLPYGLFRYVAPTGQGGRRRHQRVRHDPIRRVDFQRGVQGLLELAAA